MGSVFDTVFGNDPSIPDDVEHQTHLYVAGIVAAALLLLVVIKTGMKSAAM